MKLRIVKGPSLKEVLDAAQGTNTTLTFRIKPMKVHIIIPDIEVDAKKIHIEGDDNKVKCVIKGRSKEGDTCEILYRPTRNKKGVMYLT